MKPWAEIRSQAAGVFDLLCWDHHVEGGALRHTDGAHSATYAYRGPDLEAATPEQLAVLSQALTTALGQLGDGWLVHFDMHRRPAPGYPAGGAFPDSFTRALDRERATAFEAAGARYYSRYYLTLARRPATSAIAGALESRSPAAAIAARERRQVDDFLRAADDLAALLGTQAAIRRLGPAEQISYLRSCLHLDDQPVACRPTR